MPQNAKCHALRSDRDSISRKFPSCSFVQVIGCIEFLKGERQHRARRRGERRLVLASSLGRRRWLGQCSLGLVRHQCQSRRLGRHQWRQRIAAGRQHTRCRLVVLERQRRIVAGRRRTRCRLVLLAQMWVPGSGRRRSGSLVLVLEQM